MLISGIFTLLSEKTQPVVKMHPILNSWQIFSSKGLEADLFSLEELGTIMSFLQDCSQAHYATKLPEGASVRWATRCHRSHRVPLPAPLPQHTRTNPAKALSSEQRACSPAVVSVSASGNIPSFSRTKNPASWSPQLSSIALNFLLSLASIGSLLIKGVRHLVLEL